MRHVQNPLHSGKHYLSDEQIVQKIQAAYNADPDSIRQRDDLGCSPIFAAATMSNLNALKKPVELGVSDDLTNRDNADCLTPLEAFTRDVPTEVGRIFERGVTLCCYDETCHLSFA